MFDTQRRYRADQEAALFANQQQQFVAIEKTHSDKRDQQSQAVAAFSAGTGEDSFASFVSRSSKMRRNRIHVSSGTYCIAPEQFDRRMMSQIDLIAELTDAWLV